MRLLFCALVLTLAQPAEARRFRTPAKTKQLVVVVAADWNATSGELQRWAREKATWKRVGDPVEVNLGKSGLGWGYGLHPDEIAMERRGPLKQEGDGRSPAGVFRLLEATGYAESPPPGTKLPYRQATPRLRCVDDRRSDAYNTLVEEPASGPPPWASSEAMRRDDPAYALTVFVGHNVKPIVRGQGSCIFLHAATVGPTVGCTALPQPALETLVGWLDPAQGPLLVQLPKKEYDELARAWNLPR